MWKAPVLWRCVQKAKEVWFRGIFNLHSDGNKGLAVALRVVVQPDWGLSGGGGGGRYRQDHRPHLFPPFPFACLSLFPLKSSVSSLYTHTHLLSQSCKCMTQGINWMGRRWGGSTERSNTSLSCSLTFIYSALSNIVVCVMAACLASSALNGPVRKLQTWWAAVICMSSARPTTRPRALGPWPPSRVVPAPACLCIMEKLFAFLCRSNKQAMSFGAGGWRSGVCVLLSSPGVDKELFDGVERN